MRVVDAWIKSRAVGFVDLSREESAYLAGLIDGEGCLTITKSRLQSWYQIRLSITGSHHTIIDLCNVYGGSWKEKKRYSKMRKSCFDWCWGIEQIRWYLPQIIFFMKIKKEQAKILLEACSCCHGQPIPQDKRRLAELRKTIHKLNRAGD